MTSFEHLSSAQKTRAALHRDVQAICKETCHFLGLEITKPAMEIVAELIYKKLSVYGTDLEAFAKHAKRTTITTEDVKLLVRRCPSLKTNLNTMAPVIPNTKEKKRKTIAGIRQQGSPTPKSKDTLKEQEIQAPKTKQPDILSVAPKEKKDLENMIIDDDVIDVDLMFD